MTDNDLESKVLIGGYDISKYAAQGKNDSDISWHKLNDETAYFWTISLGHAKLYGGNPKNKDKIFQDIKLNS